MVESTPSDQNERLSDELEAQIDEALEAAKYYVPGPAVTGVEYVPLLHAISVSINTGQRLLLPVEDMQYLSDASPNQLVETKIIGFGDGIGFPSIDAHFSVEGLMEGRYGNRKWMEQLEAKRAARLKAAA